MTVTKDSKALQNRVNPWDSRRYPEEAQPGFSCKMPLREELPDTLRPFYDIGKLAAEVHQYNCLFIDMHLSNVGYRPGTERLLLLDYGAAMEYGEPAPSLERAKDLALFRNQCNYQQWQAVKAGYRELAGGMFDEVFRHFDSKPS